MSLCFTKTHDDSTNVTTLEKYLKVKGYGKVVKNKRCITFWWNINDGYFVVPINKIHKGSFVEIEEKKVYLGREIKEGELAKAVRKSMKISTT
jgi:hypothetical protein